jgi:putative ligand-binding protein with streptavidin-like fold
MVPGRYAYTFDLSKRTIMVVNYLTIIVSVLMLLTMAGATSVVMNSKISNKSNPITIMEQVNKYHGIWVTADGFIRQELLANGRYHEARGAKEHAYMGRYEIHGSHIRYQDDTGFTATGDFSGNDTLYHGGYVFYREISKSNKSSTPGQRISIANI